MAVRHLPWGDDPHVRLRDESDTYAADPRFAWGWQRWKRVRGELSHREHDGRELWPTETHRRIHRCLRMWFRQWNPVSLSLALWSDCPDRFHWRQLVEDLYLAVSQNEGLENFNHSLFDDHNFRDRPGG